MAKEQQQMCLRVYAQIIARETDEMRRREQLNEFGRLFGGDIPDWQERLWAVCR